MMILNFRAMLLASAVAVAGTSAMAAANVVLDPGFESGAFGTWISGGSIFNSISGVSHTDANAFQSGCVGSGCVIVPLTGVGGPGSISQSINLQPGIYKGDFFYRSAGFTPTVNNNQLAVSLGNYTPINQPDIAAAPYTPYSFISAASGGPTTLAFGIRQDSGFSQIDDVSLVLVDDGEGNNIAAAAQTVAVQASRDFMDHLQDRFNHAG